MPADSSKTLIQLRPVRVNSNIEISPSVFILSFKRDFSFRAGQVIGIGLTAADDPRLYSIASGENDPEVRILYNIKPEGHLTPSLAHFSEGDNLWITPPFGNFEGTSEPAYWIASGTGLAPFLSMFRSGLGSNKTLIHGGRILDSFYFSDDFLREFGDHYVRCCTREKGEGIFSGRVTGYLEQSGDLPKDQKYYLCGSAEMVVESRDILLRKGIPFHQIIAEIYF